MKIVSKSQANTIARRYPNAIRTRFDAGKYKWTGSSADYIGRDVLDISFVRAVYVERRQDQEGAYAVLMSISER